MQTPGGMDFIINDLTRKIRKEGKNGKDGVEGLNKSIVVSKWE